MGGRVCQRECANQTSGQFVAIKMYSIWRAHRLVGKSPKGVFSSSNRTMEYFFFLSPRAIQIYFGRPHYNAHWYTGYWVLCKPFFYRYSSSPQIQHKQKLFVEFYLTLLMNVGDERRRPSSQCSLYGHLRVGIMCASRVNWMEPRSASALSLCAIFLVSLLWLAFIFARNDLWVVKFERLLDLF